MTMKTLSLALAAGLIATVASAQTVANPNATDSGTGGNAPGKVGVAPGAASTPPLASPGAGPTSGAGTTGMGMANHNAAVPAGNGDSQAAASGNNNQAVTTTDANAKQPANGANSFSRGEARRRIQSEGYSKVSNLRKDHNGVWRGKGMKDGQSVKVWLDYKGNVGGES